MNIQLKQRIILVLIFVLYLPIIFSPEMTGNMILIGFNEFETLSNLRDIGYEDPVWIFSLCLILIGQTSLIYAIILKDKNKIRKYSILGTTLLLISLVILGTKNTIDFGNVWLITILTTIPFIGMSILLIYNEIIKHNTTANKR